MGELRQGDADLIASLTKNLFEESDASPDSVEQERVSRAFGLHKSLYRDTPSGKNFSDLMIRYGQILNCHRGDAILSVHMQSGNKLRLLLGAGFEWVRVPQDAREPDPRSTNAEALFKQVGGILKGGGTQAEAKKMFIQKAQEWNLFKEGTLTLINVIACTEDKFTSAYLEKIEQEYLASTEATTPPNLTNGGARATANYFPGGFAVRLA